MYNIYISSYNRYGEKETDMQIASNSMRYARNQVQQWCKDGWGEAWKGQFRIVKKVYKDDRYEVWYLYSLDN